MSKTNGHIHRYTRRKVNKDMFCDLPDCTRIMPKDILEGERSLCHRCNMSFILTREALRRAKPWCCNNKCVNLTGGGEAVEELVNLGMKEFKND